MTAKHTPDISRIHPPLDDDRRVIELPVAEVTLLEDRAQVIRRGALPLAAGAHKLAILGVAPVAQDVSIRAEARGPGHPRVTDVRVVRAVRPHHPRPEAARAGEVARLDDAIDALRANMERLLNERRWSASRMDTALQMLQHSATELSQDVAWGRHEPETWQAVFEGLFAQARALESEDLEAWFKSLDLYDEIQRHLASRAGLLDASASLVARVNLDLIVDDHGSAEGGAVIEVGYVVPNALWRPRHRARLIEDASGARLAFSSEATVWQRTGEDWTDATLKFSTARSSDSTEPPALRDDLLTAQRKGPKPPLEVREVEVQSTGPSGGGRPSAPAAVELPGVDDGGEVRTLQATAPVTVASDGRPVSIPLFRFEAPATCQWRVMAELDPAAHLAVVAPNAGAHPILAGPVELMREGGVVGQTRTLFVAPGAHLELGFGPAPDVQVVRKVTTKEKPDDVDKWVHTDTRVTLYLSHLGPEARALTITERVPVSEVPEVKVEVLEATGGQTEVDDQGMWTLNHTLNGYSQSELRLKWRKSVHP